MRSAREILEEKFQKGWQVEYIDRVIPLMEAYASQFREPSTQGGEEQLEGLLKSQLRELAERRKMDYDRLADSFERLKQENERLRKSLSSLILSMAAHPDCTKGSEFFDLVNIAQKALNPKD